MFERYTEQARRAIFHGRWEALARGAAEIEPKDIVVGVLYELDANGPLAKVRQDAESIRKLLGMEGTPDDGHHSHDDIALSKRSKDAMLNAYREAERDGVYSITSEYLLRGVLRIGDDTAQKLGAAGYSLRSIRKATRGRLPRYIPEMPSRHWWFKPARRRLFFTAIFAAVLGVLLYLHLQN